MVFRSDLSEPENKELEYIREYEKRNLLIKTPKCIYIVHPGTVELFKTLDEMPNINISFLSASQDKEDNKIRVEELMCLALGKKRYEHIKDQIKIGSFDDLQPANFELNQLQFLQFGIPSTPYKKSIKEFHNLSPEELEWSALIEDDEGVVGYGEERNLLRVPAGGVWYFDSAHELFDKKPTFAKFSKTEDFCRVNNVIYLAGLLFFSLKRAKEEKKPFCEILFELQYIKQSSNDSQEAKFKLIANISRQYYESFDFNYYNLGLEALRKVNPSLQFLTYESFFDNDQSVNKSIVTNLVNSMSAPSGILNTNNSNFESLPENQEENKLGLLKSIRT